MKKLLPVLLILFFLLPATVICQNDWKLKKDKNGIKVFSRKSDKYKFDELKVECILDGRISQLAAVLLDVNNQHQWVYKTAKSQLLEAVREGEVLYYSEIQCPWPLQNRDLVVRMQMVQNVANKVVTIEANNVDGYMPDKKHLVRIKYSNATWTVTPVSTTQFKVDYKIQVDPGDGVPAWLLNLFASNGPYESFMNLKEKIKLPAYSAAKFSFLKD